MSEAKEELLKLQETGKYVFHGTHKDLTVLSPQQAHNYDGMNQTVDGDPAVFASSHAEYAIFMAIITEENCPQGYRSGTGMKDGILKFNATQKTLDQLKDSAKGWVYVFDRRDFEKRNNAETEYVAYHVVTPIKRIQVIKDDLPSNIEVKN